VKRLYVVLLVLLAIALFFDVSGVSAQATNPPIPKIDPSKGWDGWVIDTTGTVSRADLDRIETEVRLLHETGFQTGVAIFQEYADSSRDFAVKFGDENKIGDKENRNGFAIVISLNRKSATGFQHPIGVSLPEGTRTVLSPSKAGNILDATYGPAQKEGRWVDGLVLYLRAIREELAKPKADDVRGLTHQPQVSSTQVDIATILIWIILIVIILVVFIWVTGKMGINWGEILDALATSSPGGTTTDTTPTWGNNGGNDTTPSPPSSPSPGGGDHDGGGVGRD